MSHKFASKAWLADLNSSWNAVTGAASEYAACAEFISLVPAMIWLKQAPRGKGQTIVIIPGYACGPNSTYLLRRYLESLGYSPLVLLESVNREPDEDYFLALLNRLQALSEASGEKVTLIGYNTGGLYARRLAALLPELINLVITLATPLPSLACQNESENPTVYQHFIDGIESAGGAWPLHSTVPLTAIYSLQDKLSPWPCCIEPEAEHSEFIRVRGSHSGLLCNPLVFSIIAERLAQRKGKWKPFRHKWYQAVLYGSPLKNAA